MNNEQQQIIDEVYKNYSREYEKDNSIGVFLPVARVDGKHTYRKIDEERFIGLCIYDETFSQKWGLKIEERELSAQERVAIFMENKRTNKFEDNNCDIPTKLITVTRDLSESEIWDYIHKNKIEILHQHAVLYGHEVGSEYRKSFIPTLKENYNIPTNETIESYE